VSVPKILVQTDEKQPFASEENKKTLPPKDQESQRTVKSRNETTQHVSTFTAYWQIYGALG